MTEFPEQVSLADTNPEYEEFLSKFKPKKTTDDCYTPDAVYEAVKEFAVERYGLQGREIIRPFWPGADYKRAEYSDGSVVIDNPPFSILSEILVYYQQRRQPFFLFAPQLQIFCYLKEKFGGGDCINNRYKNYLQKRRQSNNSFCHQHGTGKRDRRQR